MFLAFAGERDGRYPAHSVSLSFFNSISGVLRIELSEPTEQIVAHLQNRKAPASASIVSLSLEPSVFENDDFRPLGEAELDLVVLEEREILLRGCGDPVRHTAPNGSSFTVRDLFAAIEDTERRTRHQSDWFGGVDVHHRFFEGIHLEDDGVWRITWGS